jgi:hypothetical protein
MAKPKAKTGRPSSFTPELADEICEQISLGKSLRTICDEQGMPDKATVFRWLAADEVFRDQYVRAREAQADHMAEELLEIADDGKNDSYKDDDGIERTNHDVVARSRLRVDARKWLMSKMAPKKYGDKITQEVTGANGAPLVPVINLTIDAEHPAAPQARGRVPDKRD